VDLAMGEDARFAVHVATPLPSSYSPLSLSLSLSLFNCPFRSGSEGFIIPRKSLYEILLELIPTEKILRGKRVLSFVQGEGGVQVKCADGSIHESDILVGADEAYSAVRQNLYERLKKEGKLSVDDQKPASFSCVSLTAQTNPLDPEMFPELNENGCHFNNIVAHNKPYSVRFHLLSSLLSHPSAPPCSTSG
jgi:2-polyprenyl-6-methoxyphenol hydroxylase-like FAD-dependent oxidoreductase